MKALTFFKPYFYEPLVFFRKIRKTQICGAAEYTCKCFIIMKYLAKCVEQDYTLIVTRSVRNVNEYTGEGYDLKRTKRFSAAIILTAVMLVAMTCMPFAAQAEDYILGYYIRGSQDVINDAFDSMNVRGCTFRTTTDFSKAGYEDLLEAVSAEMTVSGCVDVAFPVRYSESTEGVYCYYTDCGFDMSMSLVYPGRFGKDKTVRIAVPAKSYVASYAKEQFPDAQVKEYASAEECLAAVYTGDMTGALVPTCTLENVLYTEKRFDTYGTYQLPEPCRLCVAVRSPEMKEKIDAAMADPETGTRTEGILRTFVQGAEARAARKNFIAKNLGILVTIPIILAMGVVIWFMYRRYKAAHREQEAVINCLSRDFECVTLLDKRSTHENRVRISPLFSSKIPEWETNDSFDQRMRLLCENLVVEEDRKRFIRDNDREHVLDMLKENAAYTVNYRLKLDGGEKYFENKYVRDEADKNSIIAGIHNVDLQVRREQELQLRIRENEIMQRLSLQIVTTLVKIIEAKDKYTNGHSLRVADYAKEIALRSGLGEKKQQEIYYMGLLHDIGKIGVPDEIIDKAGKLTEEEFAVVKKHPVLGSDILASITEMPMLREGALHHHEHYDGQGYPDGLSGEKISVESRILCVADAYDAMSSPRSFRDAMPQEKIRYEIEQGKGTYFDPLYAGIMLQMIDEDKEFKMREVHS